MINTKPIDYDPQWRGWDSKFDYTVKFPENQDKTYSFFRKKKFLIECYAEHSYREDSLIGRVSLDLLSILAGPSLQHHTLLSVTIQNELKKIQNNLE